MNPLISNIVKKMAFLRQPMLFTLVEIMDFVKKLLSLNVKIQFFMSVFTVKHENLFFPGFFLPIYKCKYKKIWIS